MNNLGAIFLLQQLHNDCGPDEPYATALDYAIAALAPPSGEPRGLDTPRRMSAVEVLIKLGYKWDGRQWLAPPSGEGVDVDTWRAVEFLRQRLCNEEESWRNLCVVMSALTTPQSAPVDGEFVLVPREATSNILAAMAAAIGMKSLGDGADGSYPITGTQSTIRQCYAAMINAAPPPPASLADFIAAQKPVPADIQAVISKQWPKYADAAEQAKPDDCPFCGQPQHYTDEDCPILSRAVAEAEKLLATRVESSRLDEAIDRATAAEAKLSLAEQRLDFVAKHAISFRQNNPDYFPGAQWYMTAPYHTGIQCVDDRTRFASAREAIDAAIASQGE